MATRNRTILYSKYRDAFKTVRIPSGLSTSTSAGGGGGPVIELSTTSLLNPNRSYAPLSTEDPGTSSWGTVAVGLPPAWVDVSEELRGYLDPYENILCTECQQGGDDAFMLLCDICDSPAHTYCVGLGCAVPEGNWYCDGCRPTALASSNAQALNPMPDNEFNNNFSFTSSPVATPRMTFDLNELYVPETPSSQVTVHTPSPRQSIGDSA
ncbi:hypothetical protein BUALT_Bualt19G0068700 [Buddleja alternifolia]|uniref:PHD-type domain-containing protein n=1 Tax=Buddleja alternifolia TaxID=168488 RepID=A0AAV6W5U5_9LAMI|nr:hypothetical protein BUALT_Bualt19G0068700 [Buddleja alternifolia]